MRTVNKVTILGYVGQTPSIHGTQNGGCVANLSVATSYRTKEKKDVTEWHRLVAFGRTAEIVRDYVDKGSQVYIEGQLQTREWEKDGVRRYTTEVVVRDLSLLGNKAAERSQRADMNGGTGDTSNPESTDDDIPF